MQIWRSEPEAAPESVGMDPAVLDALVAFEEGFADPERELAFAFVTNGELSPDFVIWRYRLQGLAFEACVD